MEIIAVIFTLLSVYLTIRLNIWCWLTGIIGIIAYLYIFFTQHLYAQSILQLIFIIQSIYGWYYWDKYKKMVYNTLSYKRILIDLSIVIILSIIFSIFLSKTNNPQPTLDIVTTLLSLLATWYMAKKIIFNWIIWIIADIFSIILFINQGLYYSSFLYIILMIMCINGIIVWNKLKCKYNI